MEYFKERRCNIQNGSKENLNFRFILFLLFSWECMYNKTYIHSDSFKKSVAISKNDFEIRLIIQLSARSKLLLQKVQWISSLCEKNIIGIVFLWYFIIVKFYWIIVLLWCVCAKAPFCVATTVKQYTEEMHCELPTLRQFVAVEHCFSRKQFL